ncbi:MAG TPA: APC family permease [Terriglobales bacterium]|nr:APC family permease [Terriglobales bacterium]
MIQTFMLQSRQPPLVQHSLVRAIGRWSLAALTVNSVIGSGIFGLPSVIAGLAGNYSPWAVLLAGAAIGIIIACWAEVASRFTEAGGPYLYARVAFGRLSGIEVGWLLWLSQLAAPAANANLFIIYLGEFWPHARNPVPRFFILTLLVGILALVNYRGVNAGTKVSNFFTIAKLLPLLTVVTVGTVYLLTPHHLLAAQSAAVPANVGNWLKAILLLVFAYGGFETALTPMAEAKDPKRDTAFALFAALALCTLLYTLIQWTVIGVVPDAAHSERPLADAARLMMGRGGAALITIGALVSVYGYLSAKILAVPRVTFALAERGDFPSFFAVLHPRFRTPYISILIFAMLVWVLSLFGSFAWNLTLSAVARLFYYAIGCAALPVLRKKQPGEAKFHLPAGNFFAALGVIICGTLLTQVDRSKSIILAGTVVIALLNWLWIRNRKEIEFQ